MNIQIQSDCATRGITRLCHFTPSRNLIHVLSSRYLKDRQTLNIEARDEVNPTDDLRLDGRLDKICCSVEYPNTYYLDKVIKKDQVFPDWVILFLDPALLWAPGTLFCPRNAATANGSLITSGWSGYNAMFAPKIRGAGDRLFTRRASHLLSCPTDLQAEVLVTGPIPVESIRGIAMKTDLQVRTERARWDSLGLPPLGAPAFVAPILFDKMQMTQHIWTGARPNETPA